MGYRMYAGNRCSNKSVSMFATLSRHVDNRSGKENERSEYLYSLIHRCYDYIMWHHIAVVHVFYALAPNYPWQNIQEYDCKEIPLYTYGIKLGNLDLFKFMQIVAIGFENHGTKKQNWNNKIYYQKSR